MTTQLDNPYTELSHVELEAQLVECEAEWQDYTRRQAELSRWAEVIQDHRTQILAAMGVGIIRVAEARV